MGQTNGAAGKKISEGSGSKRQTGRKREDGTRSREKAEDGMHKLPGRKRAGAVVGGATSKVSKSKKREGSARARGQEGGQSGRSSNSNCRREEKRRGGKRPPATVGEREEPRHLSAVKVP